MVVEGGEHHYCSYRQLVKIFERVSADHTLQEDDMSVLEAGCSLSEYHKFTAVMSQLDMLMGKISLALNM